MTAFSEHAFEALLFVSATSWTHAFLPLLGGPTLVSIRDMFQGHSFGGVFLAFVWLYTIVMTGLCFWVFRVADRLSKWASSSTLFATLMGHLSKSMAWIAAWAWTIAALGSLPTDTPLGSILSAILITIFAAGAILVGQQGVGPLAAALHRPHHFHDQMVWTIFFAAWMTATCWIGALTECAEAIGIMPISAPWLVALFVLTLRWGSILCWQSSPEDAANHAELHAFRAYAATLGRPHDASLSVGLISSRSADEATDRRRNGFCSCCQPCCPCLFCCWLPLNAELFRAALGLSALAGSWLSAVALQAASSSLWSTPWWQAPIISPI